MYLLLLAFFALYIVYQGSAFSIIFGALAFLILIVLLVMEFVISGKQEGYGKSLLEIAIAIAIIGGLWITMVYALNTSDPLDVVPSCSMLPALDRGDLIILHGVSPAALRAPVVNISRSSFDSMVGDMPSEALVCLYYARGQNGQGQVSQYEQPGSALGLFRFTGTAYEQVQSQPSTNLVQYECGAQPVRTPTGIVNEAYTKSITINGTTVGEDLNNSIIVYRTVPQDYFYSLGDAFVVHRVYALLNVSGSYYALTKGDNNPGLDMQYLNYPISANDISGTTIFSIPYLGYLKIVVSGQLSQPSGCNTTVIH